MLSHSDEKAVLYLFSQGSNYRQIKGHTNLSIKKIKSILEQSIGKLFIHSLEILDYKEFIYLEESFISFFNKLYKRISSSPTVYRNYYRFFPPCLFLFFKLEGISL
ncbi:hypothetical protein LCGC14_1213820 [marine sediment metagenome]|uniref:Uncharacterized protein n=1 Tax=marine sediment metagenome TaxID=412755 RepID=A0A0F9NVK2_9ZZZZ